MKHIIGKGVWVASDVLDKALDATESWWPMFSYTDIDRYLSALSIHLTGAAVRLGYDGRSGRHERGEA